MFKTPPFKPCCFLPLTVCLLTACQTTLPGTVDTPHNACLAPQSEKHEPLPNTTSSEPEAQPYALLDYWLKAIVFDHEARRDALQNLANETDGQSLIRHKALLLSHPSASYRKLRNGYSRQSAQKLRRNSKLIDSYSRQYLN